MCTRPHSVRPPAGARTDRHPVRSGQQADGRNRNENPVSGPSSRRRCWETCLPTDGDVETTPRLNSTALARQRVGRTRIRSFLLDAAITDVDPRRHIARITLGFLRRSAHRDTLRGTVDVDASCPCVHQPTAYRAARCRFASTSEPLGLLVSHQTKSCLPDACVTQPRPPGCEEPAEP